MSKFTVEETYARALYELTLQTEETDRIKEEISFVSQMITSQRRFYFLLRNPKVGKEEKKALVGELFREKISDTLLKFLMVLFDKRRIQYLPGIAKQYAKMVNEGNHIGEGVLVTAVPMDRAQIEKIEQEVSRLMRKQIQLSNQVDPAIIGGMKVYVEDQVLDASVRNRLKIIHDSIQQVSL